MAIRTQNHEGVTVTFGTTDEILAELHALWPDGEIFRNARVRIDEGSVFFTLKDDHDVAVLLQEDGSSMSRRDA